MDLKALLPLALSGSLFLLVLGIGLQSRWQDLTYVLGKPKLLLRSFVAVNVVVPAVAVVLCLLLPIDPATKAGLVLMAVSPLAPFAPGKMLKAGADRQFVVGTYVVLIIAAMIVVPVTVAALDRLSPAEVNVPPRIVGWFLFKSVLLPIGLGIAIGSLWPAFGKQASKIATIAAYVVILPLILLIVAKGGRGMIGLLGDGTLLAIVVTVLAGLAAGHWLGGPSPEHRMALAQAAATRHPGLAVLIARRNFDDQRVVLAVLLFLLVSIIVSALYTSWVGKRLARAGGAGAITASS